MADLSDIRLVITVIANNSAIDKMTTSMQRMNDTAAKGTTVQARALPVLGRMTKAWENMSLKLKTAEQKMDAVFRAGVHLQAVGRDLTGAGMGILNFAKDVVSTYADYDFILRQTSVALNTNAEWQTKLDKAIQSTAITLGKYKPQEVAEAYRLWGAATGDVVDSQESLARITSTVEKILIATGMAGGTVEGNIKGIYGVLKQYNLKMSDAGHVTEVLSVLTERTAANFGDLTGAFTYTGSAIGNVGGTFEDTAQVLGILADAGFRGTRAGRGLSMVFEAFLSPTTVKAEKALNKLAKAASGGKKNWEDLITPIKNGKRHFIGIRDTVANLATAMQKLGPIERQQAFNAIFTNNATRAMLPVIQAQIKLWDEQAASGKKLTSVFDEQKYSLKSAPMFFAQMTEQFKGSIDSLVGSFKNSLFPILQMMAIEIMKFAGPIMKNLQQKFKQLAALLEKNPALTKFLVRIGAVIAGVLLIGGAIFTILGTLALFASSLYLVGAALLVVVGVFTAIALAIVGFGVLVIENVHGIGDAFKNLADAFGRFISRLTGGKDGKKVISGIVESLKKLGGIALDALADGMNAIADFLNGLTDEQVALIKAVAEHLVKMAGVAVGMKALGTALGVVSSAVPGIMGLGRFLLTLGGLIPTLISGLTGAASAIRGVAIALGVAQVAAGPIAWTIMGIVAAIAAFVVAYETNFMGFRDFVNGIVDWFNANVVPVIQQAIEFLGPIIEQVVAAIGAFIGTVIGIVQGLIDFFSDLPGNIGAFIQQVIDAITGFIGTVLDTIGSFLQNLADNWAYYLGFIVGFVVGSLVKIVLTIVEWLSKVPGIAAEWFGKLLSFLVSFFGNLITSVIGWAGDIFRGIVDFFIKLPGRILDLLGTLWNTISNWFIDTIPKVIKAAGDLVAGIVDFFIKLPGRIIDALVNLPGMLITFFTDVLPKIATTLLDLGGNIVKGIWDGISGLVDWFGDRIGQFVNGLLDGFKKALGIASPAKLMLSIGENIVRGLWKGISDAKDWIVSKVEDFVESVIPGPIKDALGIKSPSRVMMGLGVNIVEGLAAGIVKTTDAYDAMVKQSNDILSVAESTLGSGLTLATEPISASSTSSNEKTINLNVDVSSSDGSVDNLDINTLAGLITGSSMVRALERMSATD